MDFRILGPLEVRDDAGRPIALGAAKQRALLAELLLHANEVVSSDHLVQALWGEDAPGTARKTLQVHVSQLRKALASDDVLLTRPPGYVIAADGGQLDLARFESLVEAGRQARADGRLRDAASAFGEALALWRGPALADVTLESAAEPELRRLEELRRAALEDRIELALAMGRHDEVVGDARALVAQEPLRERAWGQLMLALYRSGRQAEALEAYRQARGALVEELGLEPGPELKQLEQSILEHDPALAAPAPAKATPRAADSLFVGREPEIAVLSDALEAALAGEGRLVLIAGEPGIGKSRLAEELTMQATDQGARVLVGRCWEAGGAPAYWPWVQSLRPYVRDTDAESLRSQLRDGAADVAPLLPELRDLLPDLAPPTQVESEGARFRLFDSMTAFLKRMAAAQPLVVVLDDLHAADEPSLLLLRFVARELAESRLLIVAAYRDVDPTLADPLTAALTDLLREPVTRTLVLDGLGEADVGRFIELAEPGASAADLAPAVHAETEGNPLFVGEIVRLLAAERRLDEPATAPLEIPQSVREVIGRRLRHLSDDCVGLLTYASVLGREFDLDALACVSGLERDAMLELLDEGIEARVVSEVPGGRGRMRFAHALIRDAAYHGLSRSQRIARHREVGEALETLYASDLDPHLAELAHHFFEAAAGGDRDKAVDYARQAGARAAALLAYEEAVRLYELALEALGPDSAATLELRCELLLDLANAQGRAGEGADAKATFLRAAELARSGDLPELLARAAISYGGRFVWDRAVSDERLVPLLEDALAALGEADSTLRIQLLSRLGAALRGEPSRARRERICEEALKAARRFGDPAALAYALDAAEAALHAPHTAERRLAEATEIVAVAGPIGDRERLFDGHEHGFWAAWELGDAPRRASDLASMKRVSEELRQPSQRWMYEVARAVLAISEGRFVQAEELIAHAAAIGERVQDWGATLARRLQLFLLRRELGQLEGFEAEVQEDSEFPAPLVRRSVLANVHAELGRPAEAAAVVDELMRHDLANWHLDEEWLSSLCLLAETCEILGDTERAGPLYDLILPWGTLNAVAVPEVSFGSVSRTLGILATMLGRFEDAPGHFEEALRMNARMGARPAVAHTERAYARMLAARGEAGDREQALEHVGRALKSYRSLGMDSFGAKAARLERELGAASPR
jgi:DNA-binding SARP family transcriptional activator